MLHRSRRLLASGVIAAALAVTFAGTSVQALTGGDLTIGPLPKTVVAKGDEVTLRITYNCIQYSEPYNGSDWIFAVIFSPGIPSDYRTDAWSYPILCDGTVRQITLTLRVNNGGLSGPANLQFGHEAFSPDGTIGAISVWVNFPITVLIAGPK
jgi:hypothetical protein